MNIVVSKSSKWLTCLLAVAAGISGCAVNDPYSRDRSPVEVRRGENYGKPIYQGRPAPEESRPVYRPEEGFPQQREDGYGNQDYGYSEDDRYSEDKDPWSQQDQRPRSAPAVERLVAQAESAISQEEYSTAVARAENALRLDPQSVSAYHTLARAYLYQNRFSESEQMALRGLSILRGQGGSAGREVSRDLWLLIAQTRRERGDQAGAERAMQQAGGRY